MGTVVRNSDLFIKKQIYENIELIRYIEMHNSKYKGTIIPWMNIDDPSEVFDVGMLYTTIYLQKYASDDV